MMYAIDFQMEKYLIDYFLIYVNANPSRRKCVKIFDIKAFCPAPGQARLRDIPDTRAPGLCRAILITSGI